MPLNCPLGLLREIISDLSQVHVFSSLYPAEFFFLDCRKKLINFYLWHLGVLMSPPTLIRPISSTRKFIFVTWVWESARRQQQEARGLRVLLAPRQTSLHPRRWTLGAGRSPEIERDEDVDKDVDVDVDVVDQNQDSDLLKLGGIKARTKMWKRRRIVHIKHEVKHRVWIVNICCAAIVIWPLACSLLLSPIFGPCLLVQRLIATIETHATFFFQDWIWIWMKSNPLSAWNEFLCLSRPCPYYGWRRLLYFACFWAFFTISNLLNVQM